MTHHVRREAQARPSKRSPGLGAHPSHLRQPVCSPSRGVSYGLRPLPYLTLPSLPPCLSAVFLAFLIPAKSRHFCGLLASRGTQGLRAKPDCGSRTQDAGSPAALPPSPRQGSDQTLPRCPPRGAPRPPLPCGLRPAPAGARFFCWATLPSGGRSAPPPRPSRPKGALQASSPAQSRFVFLNH